MHARFSMNPSHLLFPFLALTGLCTAIQAQTFTIGGTHNPFLAGQPIGATCKGDTAPAQSPFLVPIPIHSDLVLRFTKRER